MVVDIRSQLDHRLLGERHRVGSHVGDQPRRAAAGVDTFVELLGNPHGAIGGKSQLARRLLLQSRRGEGRRRISLALALVDLIEGDDVEITLVKDGNHRLSSPEDLRRLTRTVGALIETAASPST